MDVTPFGPYGSHTALGETHCRKRVVGLVVPFQLYPTLLSACPDQSIFRFRLLAI